MVHAALSRPFVVCCFFFDCCCLLLLLSLMSARSVSRGHDFWRCLSDGARERSSEVQFPVELASSWCILSFLSDACRCFFFVFFFVAREML
uniref:Putative secreted protein n=1 Tax=Ixodes ricinus TaxID=34613 RepID=A0A6B0U735_IXORI